MRPSSAALIACALLAGCGSGSEQPRIPSHPEKQVAHGGKTVKEVKRPDTKAKGVMLIFSGGAWLAPPPDEVAATRHYEDRYSALGWVAVNVGYRPGGEQGFADATRAYDKARADHPGLPICAVGESSGGHLALMLAIERPLDCVEPVDAPVDLTKGLPRQLVMTARAVFRRDLAKWSPALRAGEIRGAVLIVEAAGDRIVPPAQARQLKAALPRADLVLLPGGGLPFIHATKVDKRAYAAYLSRERDWLERVSRRRRSP